MYRAYINYTYSIYTQYVHTTTHTPIYLYINNPMSPALRHHYYIASSLYTGSRRKPLTFRVSALVFRLLDLEEP